jgi:hypothetical protein
MNGTRTGRPSSYVVSTYRGCAGTNTGVSYGGTPGLGPGRPSVAARTGGSASA